jgi:hypothetical protein
MGSGIYIYSAVEGCEEMNRRPQLLWSVFREEPLAPWMRLHLFSACQALSLMRLGAFEAPQVIRNLSPDRRCRGRHRNRCS